MGMRACSLASRIVGTSVASGAAKVSVAGAGVSIGEPPALVLGQARVRLSHVRDARASAGGGDLDPVENGRRRRTLAVRMVGVPLFRRLLAVPVPDQPDERKARHVVL